MAIKKKDFGGGGTCPQCPPLGYGTDLSLPIAARIDFKTVSSHSGPLRSNGFYSCRLAHDFSFTFFSFSIFGRKKRATKRDSTTSTRPPPTAADIVYGDRLSDCHRLFRE